MTHAGDMIIGSGSAITLTNGLNAMALGQSLFYGSMNGPLQAAPNNTEVGINGGPIIGIAVDLGGPTAVAGFTTNPFRSQNSTATTYCVESSPDNATWTQQAVWNNPQALVDHSVTFTTPVTARYWRVRELNNSGDWAVELSKFWLWGVQGAPQVLAAGPANDILQIDPTTLLPSWKALAAMGALQNPQATGDSCQAFGGSAHGSADTTVHSSAVWNTGGPAGAIWNNINASADIAAYGGVSQLKANKDGLYVVHGSVVWSASAVGKRGLFLVGTCLPVSPFRIAYDDADSMEAAQAFQAIVPIFVGSNPPNAFNLAFAQNSGGDLTVTSITMYVDRLA